MSSIVFEAVMHVSEELQRLLCNTQQAQKCIAPETIPLSALAWDYFAEQVGIEVHN